MAAVELGCHGLTEVVGTVEAVALPSTLGDADAASVVIDNTVGVIDTVQLEEFDVVALKVIVGDALVDEDALSVFDEC